MINLKIDRSSFCPILTSSQMNRYPLLLPYWWVCSMLSTWWKIFLLRPLWYSGSLLRLMIQISRLIMLLVSGICTLIQVSKFPIPYSEKLFGRQLYLGSGIFGVIGTSIAFHPIYEIAINEQLNNGIDGITAFGNMLENTMVCEFLRFFFPLSLLKVFARFSHLISPPSKDFETRGLHLSYLPIFLQVLKRFG